MPKCPCCGAPTKNDPLVDVRRRVGPTTGAILDAIARSGGEWRSSYSLAAEVYGREGGPHDVAVIFSRSVRRLNETLADTPFRIETRMGHNGGYRMTMEEA